MARRLSSIDCWLWIAPAAAVVALCSSWLHFFWAGTVALQVWAPNASLIVPNLIAGVALCVLGLSCFCVYRAVTPADARRVFRSVLLVHGAMALTLPLSSTDLFSYLAYGELATHGLDMKQVGPGALADSAFASFGQWAYAPSVYGPVADYIMALVGWVGEWTHSPIWGAGFAYKLIVAALQFASLLVFYRFAQRTADAFAARGLVLFGLNPLLAWEITGQGHNDGLIVAGATFFLAAAAYRREMLGMTSLVLATLAKFVLAPTMALTMWAALRERGFKWALLLGLLALVMVVAFCAPGWTPGATLATWLPQLRPGLFPSFPQLSIFGVFWRAVDAVLSPAEGWQVPWLQAYAWAGRLLLLAAMVRILPRVRALPDVPYASLVVLMAIMATADKYAPWYATWMLPFAAIVPDRRWQDVVLVVTLVAAPAMSFPLLWLALPAGQVFMLVALLLWIWRPTFSRPAAIAAI